MVSASSANAPIVLSHASRRRNGEEPAGVGEKLSCSSHLTRAKASARALSAAFKYCASGKHIPTVEISGCKSGGGQQEFIHVELSDVIVVGVTPNGNAGSMWVETVSLAYSQIVIEAKEQKADGSMVAGVSGGWNVKENKVIA